MNKPITIRGGGDLGSGVALRLHRAGIRVLITEAQTPLSVRRLVSFSEAVYDGEITVEGVKAVRIEPGIEGIQPSISEQHQNGVIPLVVDPDYQLSRSLETAGLIDCRMRKIKPKTPWNEELLTIGLGPGFLPGVNCHAAVETKRGHTLGRVYWAGKVAEDTGEPDAVMGISYDRVIRAPSDGVLTVGRDIGSQVSKGDLLGSVAGNEIHAKFDGIIRGMLRSGSQVDSGLKIGDLDPRGIREYCVTVSDKALAVGGGVLEAILGWYAGK